MSKPQDAKRQPYPDYVRDTLQHFDDGLITESELAYKLYLAADGKMPSVNPPIQDEI